VSAAPVDVLRVLDHYAAEFTKRFGPDNEFVATRAAVAELIEAANRALRYGDLLPELRDPLAAALARVQP
jgi:hypothetical protein